MQRNRFQQLVQIDLLGCRNLDFLGFAAQAFHHDFVLQQFLLHAFGLHAGLINLIDRDNQRHLGRAGMADGFHRLRHDTIISGDNQHHHIGHRCTTRAHGGEGFMARCINEGYAIAGGNRDLIGADMLRDAARFMGNDIGLAQRIQKAGFAVIHMAHNGDHGRTRQQFRISVLRAFQADFDIGFTHALHAVAEFLHHQFGGIGINALRECRHDTHAEQNLNHFPAARGHTIGQFLHGDAFRHHHFTHHAFGAGPQPRQFLLAAFTFTRAPDGSNGPRTLILTFQRCRYVNAAFAAAVCALWGFLDRCGGKPLGWPRRRAWPAHGRPARPVLILIGRGTCLERQLHRRFGGCGFTLSDPSCCAARCGGARGCSLRRRRRQGSAPRGFGLVACVFLGAARRIFLGAGFFFNAARGFFGGRAHHQRLTFAIFALALRFHATIFFQHPLARGKF